jgi:hypothetical protein
MTSSFSPKEQNRLGENQLFSKGSTEIHFVNGIGGKRDAGNSPSDSDDIANFSSVK